jgi:PhnB protein
MARRVRPIPQGHHTVTPYLIVGDAASALEFYQTAFGAHELMRLPAPQGRIGHAETKIGDSVIMLADENAEIDARSPRALGGSPVSIHLYVEDVDAVTDLALAAGATELHPVKDQFYGDRSGTVVDPFGHIWHIATRKEDLSPEELRKRVAAAIAQHGGN